MQGSCNLCSLLNCVKTFVRVLYFHRTISIYSICIFDPNPNKHDRGWFNPLCGFCEKLIYRKRVKPSFFVIYYKFNHKFESFLLVSWSHSKNMNIFFFNTNHFYYFLFFKISLLKKKTNGVNIKQWCRHFSLLTHCVNVDWYCLCLLMIWMLQWEEGLGVSDQIDQPPLEKLPPKIIVHFI